MTEPFIEYNYDSDEYLIRVKSKEAMHAISRAMFEYEMLLDNLDTELIKFDGKTYKVKTLSYFLNRAVSIFDQGVYHAEKVKEQAETLVGSRILVTGDHPWKNHTGKIVAVNKLPEGYAKLIKLDTGNSVYVFNDSEFKIL